MTTRRKFLFSLGSLSAGVYLLPIPTWAQSGDASLSPHLSDLPPVLQSKGADVMDEALEMLAPYSASFRGGLANHGPMTAEALVALGRSEDVVAWVERYRRRLAKESAPSEKIDSAKWQEALGKQSRNSDWDAYFKNELSEAPWRTVVARWVPRLAPGLAAAGLHSVIRAGHAVCSLRIKETPLRIDELARALGYWASHYLALPGKPSAAGKLSPSKALRQLKPLPRELRKSRGLITTELKDLRGYDPFLNVIDLVNPSAGSPSFMTDLIATFSGVLLNTRSNSFTFLHAVTGSAAVAELLPDVSAEHQAAVQAYAWQATAGIYVRFAQPNLSADSDQKPSQDSPKPLAQRAAQTGDEHTIKLTAACTREWNKNADPRILSAALKRLSRHR